MGDLRNSILKQQMQAELGEARRLESEGKGKDAGAHYVKAGAIARMLAYESPRERSEEYFHSAGQYETVGNIIKSKQPREVSKSPDMAEQLIVSQKPSTTWDDIGGLEEAKDTLKDAIIMPFVGGKPDFVKATRTILLYGPPGTGKTLLAKASSNTLSATFFEAKASGLLSKYFGESSKIISSLFDKAEDMQPSLVFMDEIDSVAASRSGGIDDASRRVLGQLLQELEGFSTSREKVIFIGATNRPWDLDDALLSRFQRKIYVPLPDAESRKRIFEIHLGSADLGDIDVGDLVSMSEGYSGRDIASLCQAAINVMVRERNRGMDSMDAKALENYTLSTRPLAKADFEKAFGKVRPASDERMLSRYVSWEKEFG
jgi:katanin p60 ATPase-containing subunit A1